MCRVKSRVNPSVPARGTYPNGNAYAPRDGQISGRSVGMKKPLCRLGSESVISADPRRNDRRRCTPAYVGTWGWARTRRYDVLFNDLGLLLRTSPMARNCCAVGRKNLASACPHARSQQPAKPDLGKPPREQMRRLRASRRGAAELGQSSPSLRAMSAIDLSLMIVETGSSIGRGRPSRMLLLQPRMRSPRFCGATATQAGERLALCAAQR